MRRFLWHEDSEVIEGVLFERGTVAIAIDDWKSTKYFFSWNAFQEAYRPERIEWLDWVIDEPAKALLSSSS